MRCQFAVGITRVMTMATTIQQAFYPLLLTFYILGVGVYSSQKIYLNIFYNLTVWSVYSWIYNFIMGIVNSDERFRWWPNIAQEWMSFLVTITSISTSIFYYKRFRIFMKRIGTIDDTLEELGTPKMYRKLRTCLRRILLVWLVYCYITNALDMIWWFYAIKNRWYMLIPFVANHYLHVNMFMDLLFITFLWYIGNRFEKINECMKCLIIRKEHGWTRAMLTTHKYIKYFKHYKFVLWTSMHVHLELCQIARELNTIFGPLVTVEITAYLIYLIRQCVLIFVYIQMKGRYIYSLFEFISIQFFVSLYLVRLVCLNNFCEYVTDKANEMAKIIHLLTDHFRYTDVRDEIYQFALQIIHHPLKFIGLGFFTLGNSCLRNFFITITTFLIIILQFFIQFKPTSSNRKEADLIQSYAERDIW